MEAASFRAELGHVPAPRNPLALRGAVPAGAVRLLTFLPLLAFAVLHWTGQVRPSGRLSALAAVAIGTAVAAGWWQARERGHARAGWWLVALSLPLVLLAAGIPARLLVPNAWDELANGIGQGIRVLPNTTIPYKGVDEWVRADILAGGVLLALVGAALAFAPAREGRGYPHAAAVALSVLWVVPVVERNPGHPYLDGAAFALLLGAFLWAERLRSEHVRLAAGLLAGAVFVALLAAPRLDRPDAWIDYEALADRLAPPPPSTFDWNHSYDPLDWPRDGKEVVRVKARQPAYWKTVVLDDFDGVRWIEGAPSRSTTPDSEFADAKRGWEQQIRVVVKGLRSRQFVTAGYTRRIGSWSKPVLPGPGGTRVAATRELRPGDSYLADVYTPKPTRRELAAAGDHYLPFTDTARRIILPLGVPGSIDRDPQSGHTVVNQSVGVEFPTWSEDPDELLVEAQSGVVFSTTPDVVRSSPYGRTYALARRLRAESSGPYDFVRRTLRRVREGARYTESPPRHLLPLDAFLFEDRLGYCQQFSGAMALLLRMGGVPARTVSGFSPGELDRRRKEWVVKDTDAHSWVEAYFPTIGWVTFDPTPASAPPASQADDVGAATATVADDAATPSRGDRLADPQSNAAAADQGGGGGSGGWVLPIGVTLIALFAVTTGLVLRRRERRRAADPEAHDLAELRRALRRTGRRISPQTTLRELERRLGGSPAAEAYLRAVRTARFGGTLGPGEGATPAGRRALRRELAAGLGPTGRLRSWWALPPRPPRRDAVRRVLEARRGRPYTG